jgi:putative glutathione S-transferase
VPGIAETVKPRYYVRTYYSIKRLNPSGIIPKGTPVDYRQPFPGAVVAARAERLNPGLPARPQ